MKKGFSLFILGMAVILAIQACTGVINAGSQVVIGSGKSVSEERNVSNINAVDLGTAGTMDVTIGSKDSLTIEADDNLLPYIQTEVIGGRLVIKTKPGVGLQPIRPIKYHLSVTRLTSVALSSSGNITLPDLKSDNFSIAISSSGNLTMQNLECSALKVDISSSGDASLAALNAKTLNVNISSSGNVDIGNGAVTRQTIMISSSGDFIARTLSSETADVTISSSGNATLRVSTTLNGHLSSSGDINYIGNPRVNVNTSSSGRAKQIQ